jgi:hypothetical protein
MHTPKQITELWAWVVTETDGGEGIPAIGLDNGMVVPVIGADRERIESLRPILIEQTGKLPLRLVHFDQMTVVEIVRS